jgi:hypothetical protein
MRPKKAGRDAPVTGRYRVGPVWVLVWWHGEAIPLISPRSAQSMPLARRAARADHAEGIRCAALFGRARGSARDAGGDSRRALAADSRQPGSHQEVHPGHSEGPRRPPRRTHLHRNDSQARIPVRRSGVRGERCRAVSRSVRCGAKGRWPWSGVGCARPCTRAGNARSTAGGIRHRRGRHRQDHARGRVPATGRRPAEHADCARTMRRGFRRQGSLLSDARSPRPLDP